MSHPMLKTSLCALALAVAGCAADAPATKDSPGLADSGAPKGGDAAPAGSFNLLWQDDFDSFDSTRWQLMTHTFDGNLAQFSNQNVAVANGVASLKLTRDGVDSAHPFSGVEMRSRDTITYGKAEARVKFARGSGVISAMVLIYTPWPADDWNELDIEYLGKFNDRIQFNTMVYMGPPVSKPVTKAVSPTQNPKMITLGFDPTDDFHVYAIEWTPSEARFLADGIVKYSWSDEISRMKLPQNVLLTIWASSSSSWAGPIQDDSAPTSADYDWFRLYTWQP